MIRSILLLSLVVSALCCVLTAAQRPNIVFIYGDDVGYGDVGVYGSEKIPTPNIDRLAAEGLMFTDGHCSAATCTPSRFSMLTGLHGFRKNVGILPPKAPLSIPTDVLTLPKMLKEVGYATAVIGKWHLGLGRKDQELDWNCAIKPGPLEIGFDYSYLLPTTNDRVPCVYVENHHVVNLDPNDPITVSNSPIPASVKGTRYPNAKKDPSAMTYYKSTHGHNNSVINGIGRIGYMQGGMSALWDDETMADVFVDKTKKYLKAQKPDQPFFLYFASQDIHVPRAPHRRFQGKTDLGHRGDAMVQFDWTVGEIVKTLEEQGLRENTIIFFSSDNGPTYDDGYDDGTTVRTSSRSSDGGHFGAGPFRGGKYQIYEGGTRVPFILSWPKGIEAGKSSALVNQIDFMASFAKLTGYKLGDNDAVDSRNSLDALLGKDSVGHLHMIQEAKVLALRKGPWKYVSDIKTRKDHKKGKKSKVELYHLDRDIGETDNVIKTFPEIAEDMRDILVEMVEGGRVRPL